MKDEKPTSSVAALPSSLPTRASPLTPPPRGGDTRGGLMSVNSLSIAVTPVNSVYSLYEDAKIM